jgi:hypothetical protein
MIAKLTPLPENPNALRAAQSGDLCILLVPGVDRKLLVDHQRKLQEICGGQITSPVHVTTQRIEARDYARLEKLTEELRSQLLDFTPFPIDAASFRSIYDPYRKSYILKWIAELSKPLQQFSQAIEHIVYTTGYKSLYTRKWISTWISALEGIDDTQLPLYLDEIEIPQPLFIGTEVIISKINGQNEYIFLDRFAIGGKL